MPLIRKARNFLQRPLFEQCWFLPAWVLLGLSRLAIITLSFRRLAPRLGHRAAAAHEPQVAGADEARAAAIGRTVSLAARYTPWESNCFPQAVAARLLLGLYRIPYALLFGLAPAAPAGNTSLGAGGAEGFSGAPDRDRPMQAHAWVTAGRITVTGGARSARFVVVGCFTSPPGRPAADQAPPPSA